MHVPGAAQDDTTHAAPGLVPPPQVLASAEHVPFAVHAGEVALVGAFALLTAIVAAVLPARAAARLAAGEAIRLSR